MKGPQRLTVEDARGMVARRMEEAFVDGSGITHIGIMGDFDHAENGQSRRATPAECLESIEWWEIGDLKWWIGTLDAAAGGLAALTALLKSADSQNNAGLLDELAPHLDAIGATLKNARSIYKADLRTWKTAVAEAAKVATA